MTQLAIMLLTSLHRPHPLCMPPAWGALLPRLHLPWSTLIQMSYVRKYPMKNLIFAYSVDVLGAVFVGSCGNGTLCPENTCSGHIFWHPLIQYWRIIFSQVKKKRKKNIPCLRVNIL